VASAGCSGPAATRGAIDKLPPQVLDTTDVSESVPLLPGVGARCTGGVCACREVDAAGNGSAPESDEETSPVPAGHKRFELRTGRGDDSMRITIEGVGTFEKSGPQPEAKCIYVDLPNGAFRVRYHVIAANPTQGAEPRLRISEYSPRFKRWYRTFAFRCTDGSEPCTKDLARDTFQILTKTTNGKFDPCGSTKAQGLRFWTDKGADAAVSDFNLQVVLNIYQFDPRFPPGTARCRGLGPTKGAAKPDDGEMTVAPAQP
jgi:hypothetical protein